MFTLFFSRSLVASFYGKNLSIEAQYDIAVAYYKAKGKTVTLTKEQCVALAPACNDCKADIGCLLTKKMISQAVFDKLSPVMSQLNNSKSLLDFTKVISSFETMVLGDKTLSAADRDTLLAFCSIASKSAEYWTANPPSSGKPWWQIALADAAGGAFGAATGGIVGAAVLGAICSTLMAA